MEEYNNSYNKNNIFNNINSSSGGSSSENIYGVPINTMNIQQIENEIKIRGGKVNINIDKEVAISQLKDLLNEESLKAPPTTTTTTTTTSSSTPNKNGKRSIDNLTSPSNKKIILGDPKALQLEKKILNGFNFYPIVERLKFDELGFRLVKEYTRFIVVKMLTHDIDSAFTLPPPLVGRIWISHILDTNRYEELCKLIELKIHHNPDGIDDISHEEKRKRYEKTIELYEKYFTKTTMDTEIWENDYLLHSEDEYEDQEEEEEEDEEDSELQILQKQKQKLIIENSKNVKIPTSSPSSTTASAGAIDINSPSKQVVSYSSSIFPTTSTTNNSTNIKNGNPITTTTTTTTTTTAATTTTTTTTPNKTNTSGISGGGSGSGNTSTTAATTTPSTTNPTPFSTLTSSTANSKKSSKSTDQTKISIGFIYVKNQKKEVTTFHGVSLAKTLFKVIKAYTKLKGINLSSTKFSYNGKDIMNETPESLNMKDGDIINVLTNLALTK